MNLAETYNLYYSANAARPEAPSVPGINGTSWTISGLSNGTTYYVWAQAENSGGKSAVSGIAQINLVLNAPAKPTLIPGNGSLAVRWTAVDLADTYNLYYSTGAVLPETPSVSPVSGTSYTITGLTNGTTYHIWVQAVNAGGPSAASPLSSAAPHQVHQVLPTIGTALTAGQWSANTISSSSQTDYYYIGVTAGQTYTVYWNDRYEGDGVKTARVYVSAYWYDDNTSIFGNATSGYTTGKSFTANKDGWVIIKVNVSSTTGSYAVKFTDN